MPALRTARRTRNLRSRGRKPPPRPYRLGGGRVHWRVPDRGRHQTAWGAQRIRRCCSRSGRPPGTIPRSAQRSIRRTSCIATSARLRRRPANPQPGQLRVPPRKRGHPPTLDRLPAERPWRRAAPRHSGQMDTSKDVFQARKVVARGGLRPIARWPFPGVTGWRGGGGAAPGPPLTLEGLLRGCYPQRLERCSGALLNGTAPFTLRPLRPAPAPPRRRIGSAAAPQVPARSRPGCPSARSPCPTPAGRRTTAGTRPSRRTPTAKAPVPCPKRDNRPRHLGKRHSRSNAARISGSANHSRSKSSSRWNLGGRSAAITLTPTVCTAQGGNRFRNAPLGVSVHLRPEAVGLLHGTDARDHDDRIRPGHAEERPVRARDVVDPRFPQVRVAHNTPHVRFAQHRTTLPEQPEDERELAQHGFTPPAVRVASIQPAPRFVRQPHIPSHAKHISQVCFVHQPVRPRPVPRRPRVQCRAAPSNAPGL